MQTYGGDSEQHDLTRRALLASGLVAGAGLVLTRFGHRAAGDPAQASTTALPRQAAAARVEAGKLEPRAIVGRHEWGADERRRRPSAYDATVEKIVVHHTALDDGSGAWARQVREIYESETGNGYRDIAYHFLVDPHGVVYEGRWARNYPAGARPDAQDAHGRCVRGGHARGHNERTLGIALLGDYRTRVPSDGALAALVSLLASGCARWRIDPHGASRYVDRNGRAATFPNVIGHRDIRATLCPGAHIESLLPALRDATAEHLARAAGGAAPA